MFRTLLMRKKIVAANWKMNLNASQARELLTSLKEKAFSLKSHQEVIVAPPFPFIPAAVEQIGSIENYFVAAQNCSDKEKGAYTGEVSTAMLGSIGVSHIITGHSERREYYGETNGVVAAKVNRILAEQLTPIFCCGESLETREAGDANAFVGSQLNECLFHLDENSMQKVVIAYEPIWAIGTGKTASSEQAQEMHAHIRAAIAEKYGNTVADSISILYGGSVKGSNAAELFGQQDVDGALVGGASLDADDFSKIIVALS